MKTYHAENLEDIAKMFDERAEIEDAASVRHGLTKHGVTARACARVWRFAAVILRSTEITLKAGEEEP